MAFQVDGQNSFISKLRQGGARATLFEVNITPKGEASGSGQQTEFKFMCKGVQIPANALGITTVNYFGRAVKIPGNRTFEDLTTTIINDEGYPIRNQLENWMHKLNSHVGNVRDKNFQQKLSGYVADMTLTTYTKTGVADRKYRFENCFPTGLDQIDVNWDPNDAVMEYSVTWAYDYWEHIGITGT
tara:strand:- start:678 stop:1235 length:558 start_codon:yes stop_codon:yes gene_type:complete